jgi:hypothetical protein
VYIVIADRLLTAASEPSAAWYTARKTPLLVMVYRIVYSPSALVAAVPTRDLVVCPLAGEVTISYSLIVAPLTGVAAELPAVETS